MIIVAPYYVEIVMINTAPYYVEIVIVCNHIDTHIYA